MILTRPGLEEREERTRGAVSLLILAQNVNLSLLAQREALASAFRWTLQEDIAKELGSPLSPEHVEVRVLADSAAIPVTVTPPKGMSCHEVHRLLSSKQLRWSAGTRLDSLEGFNQVCLSSSWCFFNVGMPSIVAAPDALSFSPTAEGRGRASLNQAGCFAGRACLNDRLLHLLVYIANT